MSDTKAKVAAEAERRRLDATRPADEFMADLEARHGKAAAAVIARSMGITPRRRKPTPEIVGAKAKPLPALSSRVLEQLRRGSPDWRDLDGVNRLSVTIGVVKAARMAKLACTGCGRPLGMGEMVKVEGRHGFQTERFHPACVPSALRNTGGE